MSGYIKLYRGITDNPLWDKDPYSAGQAWIDLLLAANFKPRTVYIRGNALRVERGQLAWSTVTMAQRWRWSRNKVLRFLKTLERECMIKQQTGHLTTVITICNYEKYQGFDTADETAGGAAGETAERSKNQTKSAKTEQAGEHPKESASDGNSAENQAGETADETAGDTTDETADETADGTQHKKGKKGKNEKKGKRATPLPADFHISEAMRAWATNTGLTIDIDQATDRWKDAMLAKGHTYIDWTAAWRNGMKLAQRWYEERRERIQPVNSDPTAVNRPYRAPMPKPNRPERQPTGTGGGQ